MAVLLFSFVGDLTLSDLGPSPEFSLSSGGAGISDCSRRSLGVFFPRLLPEPSGGRFQNRRLLDMMTL